MSLFDQVDPADLDREPVEALAAELHAAIMRHYRARIAAVGLSQTHVFEALNAFAIAVAPVLLGADDDRAMLRDWFIAALDQNTDQIDEIWRQAKNLAS